jgi:hypothetical protein
MSTTMHRLQISLPQSQLRYLADRARREGISIAELIRRFIHRESESFSPRSIDSLLEIIGIGREREPLIEGIPVSEQPDLYIYEKPAAYSSPIKKRTQKGKGRR